MKQQGPIYPSAMRDLPEEDRPRERIARLGAEALRDAELLAVLFRTGTRERNAVQLAELALHHFGSLRSLARATIEELQQVKGLGKVKAVEIKAALELGKRLAVFTENGRARISSPQDVADLLMVRYKELETEHIKCLLLNTKNEVMKVVDVSKGTADAALALPRDVFRAAVREGATAIILAHNHPSGDPEPSRDDIALTRRLSESAELMGIALHDHVVFGDGRYVSLKERNLM